MDEQTQPTEFQPGEDIANGFHEVIKDRLDKTAIVYKDRRITWGQLAKRVNRVANALAALGFKKGDRVGMLSRNSVEICEVFLGCLCAGGCAVPLPSMVSPEALRLMLEDSNVKALFVSKEMRSNLDPFVEELDILLPGASFGLDFEDGPWASYAKWTDAASDEYNPIDIGADDEFNIIYSSGTTGTPKGILHTHGFRKGYFDGIGPLIDLPGMVCGVTTPLYSNTTLTAWLPSMRFGVPCVIMEKFNTQEFLKLIGEEKITFAMLVPVQYERIVKELEQNPGKYDLSSIVGMLCTSAPLHAETKRKILKLIPGMFVEFYGMTEGGVSCRLNATENPDKLDSVGQPSENCEILIIDDDGNILPPNTPGEIIGYAPSLMKGYENKEEETKKSLYHHEDGRIFMRSGDVGYLDDDGFLFLSDRKKDMIISGGFNIYPIDLEKALLEHPDVLEVSVYGVPSEQWGETPFASVVLEKGADVSSDELLKWANGRLGKAQKISGLEFREELPRSPVGKILKKDLQKDYQSKKA